MKANNSTKRGEDMAAVAALKRGGAGQRVFKVASRLFRNEGIRAVGVEAIVKKAGVAKISLYRSFASKDDLIVAYLEGMNATYWKRVDENLAKHDSAPRNQVRAYLAFIAESATTPGYKGCPFINYSAEFPDPSHPGHRIAEANRVEMRRRLLSWTNALKAPRPSQLADSLMLLVDGAYASSQILGGPTGPAALLVWAAEALIEGALAESSESRK
jgi:AcrR family transcriptional regulator